MVASIYTMKYVWNIIIYTHLHTNRFDCFGLTKFYDKSCEKSWKLKNEMTKKWEKISVEQHYPLLAEIGNCNSK